MSAITLSRGYRDRQEGAVTTTLGRMSPSLVTALHGRVRSLLKLRRTVILGRSVVEGRKNVLHNQSKVVKVTVDRIVELFVAGVEDIGRPRLCLVVDPYADHAAGWRVTEDRSFPI